MQGCLEEYSGSLFPIPGATAHTHIDTQTCTPLSEPMCAGYTHWRR